MSWWSKHLDKEEWSSNADLMRYMQTEGRQNEFVSMLMMTVPSPRYKYYQHKDFSKIKQGVLDYADEIKTKLGNYPFETSYELLDSMLLLSAGILAIGLVFDIMLIMFVMISVLLIYSLLMITIETKTFDTGVMRMVGLSGKGFVAMIFTQAVMFVLPSLICALVAVVPCLWFIYDKIEKTRLPWSVALLPGWGAVSQGLAIGILIPTLSAIIPISRALAKSLPESLNVSRTQTQGIVYSLQSDSKVRVLPYLVFGTICVVTGMTVYYFLPYSLLTQNAGLLLNIFFFILIGLILGLTLIAVNLRGFLENILIYVLLFWEKRSMRILVKKNLIAHKRTNKLTSIIYALTLGCIIFLIEAANLQILEISQF